MILQYQQRLKILLILLNKVKKFSGVKAYKFKAKDSEIKPYPFCLGNILKDFMVGNVNKPN